MKRHVLVAAVVAMGIAAVAVAGCGNSLPQGAIAKVGGSAITQAQFDQYMSQAKAQAASNQPFPSPGTTQYNQYAAQLVNYLVQQQLITNEAGKLKISVSDKDITDRLTQLYQAYGGQPKVMAILKKQGMTLDQLKDLLKNQILGQKVYEQVVAKAKPTAQQISDYYNAHKSQFNQPETRDVRHILVKTKAEADTVRALLAANDTDAEWAKVAKQYSTDPGSKKNGGSLGTVSPGQMVAPFDKAAFSLKPDTISVPVKSQYGWHVIEVTKVNPAKTSTLQSATAQITQLLTQQNQQKVWQDWLDQAKKDAHILYAPGFDPAKLTASPSPAPSTAKPAASPSPSKTK
jgi:parvulin-like peptidyl-prolyl isomerase